MTSTESNPMILNEFHSMISSTAMWLNVLDKDARVIMWNKGAELISGYCKDEIIGRRDVWERLYPDEKYRNKIFEKAIKIINQGKEVADFETTIRCKDGSERILSWNSNVLKDECEEVIGSLAIARDVTEIINKRI